MANKQIHELTSTLSNDGTDLLIIEVDIATTPSTRKQSRQDFINGINIDGGEES